MKKKKMKKTLKRFFLNDIRYGTFNTMFVIVGSIKGNRLASPPLPSSRQMGSVVKLTLFLYQFLVNLGDSQSISTLA